MVKRMYDDGLKTKCFGILYTPYTMIEDMAQNAEFWLSVEISEISKQKFPTINKF